MAREQDALGLRGEAEVLRIGVERTTGLSMERECLFVVAVKDPFLDVAIGTAEDELDRIAAVGHRCDHLDGGSGDDAVELVARSNGIEQTRRWHG